jgi:hypothetical protein
MSGFIVLKTDSEKNAHPFSRDERSLFSSLDAEYAV